MSFSEASIPSMLETYDGAGPASDNEAAMRVFYRERESAKEIDPIYPPGFQGDRRNWSSEEMLCRCR